MRPKGSARELEVRRVIAGRMPLEGRGIREVARMVGASPSLVERWKVALRSGGMGALKAKPHPGRPPKLKPEQREALKQVFLNGPKASGFSTVYGLLLGLLRLSRQTLAWSITLATFGIYLGVWASVHRSL